MLFRRIVVVVLLLAATAFADPGADAPFRITVIDRETRRGVPMVELTTVHGVTFITDSAGVVAFDEPGLMDQRVFFNVRSHGYSFPKDGFGIAGKALDITPGGSATLEIDRMNLAERLYRVTGAGIYRDSVILGDTPPIEKPLFNSGVVGQDSVQNVIYQGKLWCLWGDTSLAQYPLGVFQATMATALLPQDGGLSPDKGINLTYFTNARGIVRPIAPIPDRPGLVWPDALMVVKDPHGRDALLAHYVRLRKLGENLEQGISRWNDDSQVFEPIVQVPLDAPVIAAGHPIEVTDEQGQRWFYYANPLPLIRCRAEYETLLDHTQYEAYTCLKPGSRLDVENPALDRDGSGKLVYAWKANTAPISHRDQQDLIQRGHIKPDEALIRVNDSDSGKVVMLASGSTFWNDYRKRYITLAQELFGTSVGGEVWYLESESLTGPWVNPRKIITHDNYTFYNVKHHPYFDQQGGRVIYFEGTYTTFITNRTSGTPRYDYNQIMYRLDLAKLGLN